MAVAGPVREAGHQGGVGHLDDVGLSKRLDVVERRDRRIGGAGAVAPAREQESDVGAVHSPVPVEVRRWIRAVPGREHRAQVGPIDRSRAVEIAETRPLRDGIDSDRGERREDETQPTCGRSTAFD